MDSPREEPLDGANSTDVVRVGNTVRRATGPWTPSVHQMLDACAEASVEGTPRVQGIDDQGREVLSFVDGTRMDLLDSCEMWDPQLIDSACGLLRKIHDATAPLVDSDGAWRSPTHHPAEVICHNDFAPYNLIVTPGGAVAAIDFDFASPGPRAWDLAYFAYRMAPFASDAPLGGQRVDTDERLARIVSAYGAGVTRSDVLELIPVRLTELAVVTRERSRETGRADLLLHANMYDVDAARLRGAPPEGG